MRAFRRRQRTVLGVLEPNEGHLLATFAGQLVELLSDRSGPSESEPDPLFASLQDGPRTPPDDPVLARLLPSAYADDEDAAEFRRFTERGLADAKVANARAVLASLEAAGLHDDAIDRLEVELDPAAAQAWLRWLTDVRLALAVRLGIESDDDSERIQTDPDPAVAAMADVYDWLGFVQESLVRAL